MKYDSFYVAYKSSIVNRAHAWRQTYFVTVGGWTFEADTVEKYFLMHHVVFVRPPNAAIGGMGMKHKQNKKGWWKKKIKRKEAKQRVVIRNN